MHGQTNASNNKIGEGTSFCCALHEFHNQIMNYKEPIFYPECNLKINLSYQHQPWKQQPEFQKQMELK